MFANAADVAVIRKGCECVIDEKAEYRTKDKIWLQCEAQIDRRMACFVLDIDRI